MTLSLEDHINIVLFQADLLNTCCVANEAYDEYQHIAEELHSCIEDNNHTICKEMLEEILSESLSLDDGQSVTLSDFVSQTGVQSVISDLKEYLLNNFSK